jgi:hypothetical protein
MRRKEFSLRADSAEPLGQLLAGLLEDHREEVGSRQLVWAREFDTAVRVVPDERSLGALRRLLAFVLATVPDGCEIYLGAMPARAPVQLVGSARLVARWQVSGQAVAAGAAVVPLHPIPGDAMAHAKSALAEGVRQAFDAAGWRCEIDAEATSRELVVRAEVGTAC